MAYPFTGSEVMGSKVLSLADFTGKILTIETILTI